MNFKNYYSNLNADEKKQLAERLDTSLSYLSQLANGHRGFGAKYLLNIESATNGALKASDLRAA